MGFALYFLAFITAQGSFHCTASFAENKSLREGRGRKKPLEGGFLEKVPQELQTHSLRTLDRRSENHDCELGIAKKSSVEEPRFEEWIEFG